MISKFSGPCSLNLSLNYSDGFVFHFSARATLQKFMLQSDKQPPIPSETIVVNVSAELQFLERIDLDFFADMAKSMKDAGLKVSLSTGELSMEINLANIPLA
jgi:hypothetical protein